MIRSPPDPSFDLSPALLLIGSRAVITDRVGEMLRFDPLLTLREAAGPEPGLNKHPTDRLPDTVSPVKTVAAYGTGTAAIMRNMFHSLRLSSGQFLIIYPYMVIVSA